MFKNLKKKMKKNSIEKKSQKLKKILAAPLLFLTKNVYNSCFSNQHFAQIIFPCTLCNGLSPQGVPKLQHQNSNYNLLA